MGVPPLVIARTDALAADLLTTDVDERDRPFLTGERTAEGFFRVRRARTRRSPAAWPTRRTPTCSGWRPASPDLELRPRVRRGGARRVPGKMLAYNCSPSFNWKKQPRRRRHRALPERARRDGLQVPVRHPGRLPRAQPLDVRAGPRLRRERHDRLRASCRRRSSPPRRTATPRPSTRREVGTGYFDAVSHRAQPGQLDDRPEAARPKRSSSDARCEEITITGTTEGRYAEILTPEAVGSWWRWTASSAPSGCSCWTAADGPRTTRTDELDFLPTTAVIRDDASWTVAPRRPDLLDRRVEITGPPERKMTINALNSGAQVWMADFEDATAPTWENVVVRPAQPAATHWTGRSTSPRRTAANTR